MEMKLYNPEEIRQHIRSIENLVYDVTEYEAIEAVRLASQIITSVDPYSTIQWERTDERWHACIEKICRNIPNAEFYVLIIPIRTHSWVFLIYHCKDTDQVIMTNYACTWNPADNSRASATQTLNEMLIAFNLSKNRLIITDNKKRYASSIPLQEDRPIQNMTN